MKDKRLKELITQEMGIIQLIESIALKKFLERSLKMR
jgi:hypothetical protein